MSSLQDVEPDLVRIALVGTARHPRLPDSVAVAPGVLGSPGSPEHRPRSADPAVALLDLAVRRRVLRLLAPPGWAVPDAGVAALLSADGAPDRGEAPAGARLRSMPCPSEAGAAAPSEADLLLDGLLAGGDGFGVACWLSAAARRRVVVSPLLWSRLAAAAVSSRTIDRSVLAVALGPQGCWFVGQNPAWDKLSEALAVPPALSAAAQASSGRAPDAGSPAAAHAPPPGEGDRRDRAVGGPEALRLVLGQPPPWPDAVIDAAITEIGSGRLAGRDGRTLATAAARRLPLSAYAVLEQVVDRVLRGRDAIGGPAGSAAYDALSVVERIMHLRRRIEAVFAPAAPLRRIELPDRRGSMPPRRG